MLELPKHGDFMPESAQVLGTTINAAQDLNDNESEYDKQRRNADKGSDLLAQDRNRRPCPTRGSPDTDRSRTRFVEFNL